MMLPPFEFTPTIIAMGIIWFTTAFIAFSGFMYLLQLKEYRFDRLRDFFRTHEGQKLLSTYPYFLRTIYGAVIFIAFHEYVSTLVLFGLFLCGDVIRIGYHYYEGVLRRPKYTLKASLLITFGIAVEAFALYLYTHSDAYFLLLGFRPIIIVIGLLLISVPTYLAKKTIIACAKAKLQKYKKLRVIGITGSYGKSTTKEFLSYFLSLKYQVAKTPKNTNTEIGVAKFILKTDFSKTDFFVVEMGAYCKGEIQRICTIVRPSIGILTAINEQHLSLFGSIENIQKTKYELFRSLPKEGLAVANSDNLYVREPMGTLECRVKTFGYDEEWKPTFLIDKAEHRETGLSFEGVMNTERYHIEAPIMGEHFAMNIAACIIVGIEYGLSKEEIIERAKTLLLPEKVLNVYTYGKATIIDDSYNSNPDGFKAALELLASYPSPRKRIVITRGMLELGNRSEELHAMIGGAIAYAADEVIVLSEDSAKAIQSGMPEKYHTTCRVMIHPKDLLKYIEELADTDAVILLENRIPSLVYNEIQRRKRRRKK